MFGLPDDPPGGDAGGDPQLPAGGQVIEELELEQLGAHVLGFIVEELEATDGYDSKLTYPAREQLLERLRRRIRAMLERLIATLHGADFPSCKATLETLALKSGITGRITIARTEPNRHALFDSVGKNVLILIGDVEAMMGEAAKVKPTEAQQDLFTGKPAPTIPDVKPGCRGCGRPVGDQHADYCPVWFALKKDGEFAAEIVMEADTDPNDEPESEPAPEVPGDWIDVSTLGESFREMHTGTQEVRRSRAGLAIDLVNKLATYNLRTDVDSINILHDDIAGRTRSEILAALLWIDAVLTANEDDAWPERPVWLIVPKDLQT